MKTAVKPLYLLGLLMLLCVNAKTALGSDTVLCESDDDRLHVCRLDNARDKNIVLDRKLSKSSCTEGRSWGVNHKGIWVDRGCRAVFRVSEYRDRRDRGGYGRDGDYRDRGYDDRHYDDRNNRYRDYNDRGYPERGNVEKFDVGQTIRRESSWVGDRIEQARVERIKVLVRRLSQRDTDAHISVVFDDNTQLGSQQVDAQDLYWIEFNVGSVRAQGRKIVVTAHSGNLYVEKVVVQ